jgi:hypothetical protein
VESGNDTVVCEALVTAGMRLEKHIQVACNMIILKQGKASARIRKVDIYRLMQAYACICLLLTAQQLAVYFRRIIP